MRLYDYSQSVVLLSEEEDFGLEIPRRYQNGSEKSYELSSLDEDFEWQVTYKFSSDFRPNVFSGVKYGGSKMTYRRLYELLCQKFNDGIYFLDTYFNEVYPFTVKPEADKALSDFKQRALLDYAEFTDSAKLTSKDMVDRRTSVYKALREYDRFLDSEVEAEGEEMAKVIKDDIVHSLEHSIIRLANPYVSGETMRKRMKAGLPPFPKFFASGEFIKNVIVYCRLRRKQWQVPHYQPTQE